MTKNSILLGSALALAALAALAACAERPKEERAAVEPEATSAPSAAPADSAAPTQAAATSLEGAAPTRAAAPSASADPGEAAPAPSASAAGPKVFDCGAKGQKPCPMQGWMKGVMGGAASSGDGEKLARALSYVAARPPPGMDDWASISEAGAAKAKAGDIDGAKQSCKQCHDAYKATYKSSMRDRPF